MSSKSSTDKALKVISGKWKSIILKNLIEDNLRLRDLLKIMPAASKRTLTQQLGELIEDGVIKKKDFEVYPRKVEYSITNLGRNLLPLFKELEKFGSKL